MRKYATLWLISGALLIATCLAIAVFTPGCINKKPDTPTIAVTDGADTLFCKTIAIDTPPGGTGKERAVGAKGYFWPNGSQLKVGWFGGSETLRGYVRSALTEWGTYANLTFTYPTVGPYDLRVSFNPSSGSWSYVGTQCKNIPQTSATANIGWAGFDVAAHEMGHALGLLHEHQNPTNPLCLNEAVVIADLSGPPNYWSEAMIRYNVIDKHNPANVITTPLDPTSIMMYGMPASWTCNNVGFPGGKVLSPADKAFIAQQYPKTTPPPPPPPGNITLSTAQAQEIVSRAQKAKIAADSAYIIAKKNLGL